MKGYVQIYTGNGKGKTTAALGLAFRARGAGLRVDIVQFLKRDGCSEHKSCAQMGINICTGESVALPPWDKKGDALWRAHTKAQYAAAMCALTCGSDVVILDEIMAAITKGYLSREDVQALLDARLLGVELILTGRDAPQWLIDRADLVTRMEIVKHYVDQGIRAREGIEY